MGRDCALSIFLCVPIQSYPLFLLGFLPFNKVSIVLQFENFILILYEVLNSLASLYFISTFAFLMYW
jgi:hypothetical protein